MFPPDILPGGISIWNLFWELNTSRSSQWLLVQEGNRNVYRERFGPIPSWVVMATAREIATSADDAVIVRRCIYRMDNTWRDHMNTVGAEGRVLSEEEFSMDVFDKLFG